MKHDFWQGKTILVTGTSSGIGKAFVDELSNKRCKIFSVSRSKVSYNRHTIAEIIHLPYDISNERDIKTLYEKISKQCDKLDILVNNAGITAHGRFDATGISVYRKIFDINFFGSINLTQTMVPLLKKARGTVMTVSTVSGFYGIPGRAAYSSSKAALHAAFESFGIEMKEDGVRSIVICPPYTKTGLRTSGLDSSGQRLNEAQHQGKIKQPQDVAKYMLDVLEKEKTGIVTMDFSGLFVKWMRTIAPSLLDKILFKKLYKDFH